MCLHGAGAIKSKQEAALHLACCVACARDCVKSLPLLECNGTAEVAAHDLQVFAHMLGQLPISFASLELWPSPPLRLPFAYILILDANARQHLRRPQLDLCLVFHDTSRDIHLDVVLFFLIWL